MCATITISLRTLTVKLFGVPVNLPTLDRSISPVTAPRICRAYVAHMSSGVVGDEPLNISIRDARMVNKFLAGNPLKIKCHGKQSEHHY